MSDKCDYKWRRRKRCDKPSVVLVTGSDDKGHVYGLCPKHWLDLCEHDESFCDQVLRKCDAVEDEDAE